MFCDFFNLILVLISIFLAPLFAIMVGWVFKSLFTVMILNIFCNMGVFFIGKHLSRGRTFGMAGCSLVSVAVKFYSLCGWVGGL